MSDKNQSMNCDNLDSVVMGVISSLLVELNLDK